MKSLKDELRAADPVNVDEGLSQMEIERMRAAVLSAASPASGAAFTVGPVFALVAAGLVVAVASATWVVQRRAHEVAPVAARVAAPQPAPASGERRQLLLEAPGGTRIIWTFNESFQLR